MTRRALVLGWSILLLFAVSPSLAAPAADPHSAESVLALAGDLHYYAALSQSPLHARLFDNAGIYAELVRVYDAALTALDARNGTSSAELVRLVDLIEKSKDEASLDLLGKLKQRSFGSGDASIGERAEKLAEDAASWRGSYLEYLKAKGPSIEEIRSSDAPEDAKALLLGNGFLVGGIHSAIGDALTALGKYREAIFHKKRAWDALKPQSKREYRFASDIALDVATLGYVSSAPQSTSETEIASSFEWLDRSLDTFRKSDGSSSLLAYRLQFRLLLMLETRRFERLAETIDEALSIGSFVDLVAVNGVLALAGSGQSQSERERLDILARKLETAAKNSGALRAAVGLAVYYRAINDVERYKVYLEKAKKFLQEIEPENVLENRSVKLYENVIKDDYQDQMAMIRKIDELYNNYKYKEALDLCKEFVSKYKDYTYIIIRYGNCIQYAVVKPALEECFIFPRWSYNDESFINFKSKVKDEIDAYLVCAEKWISDNINNSSHSQDGWYLSQMRNLLADCYRLDESANMNKRLLLQSNFFTNPSYMYWNENYKYSKILSYIAIKSYVENNDYNSFKIKMADAINLKKDWVDNHPEQTEKLYRAQSAFALAFDYIMVKDYDNSIDYFKNYCIKYEYFNILSGYAYSCMGQSITEKSISLYPDNSNIDILKEAESAFKSGYDFDYKYSMIKILYKPMAALGYVNNLLLQKRFEEAKNFSNDYLNSPIDISDVNIEYVPFFNLWKMYYDIAVMIKKAEAERMLGKIGDSINILESLIEKYPDKPDYGISGIPYVVFMFNGIGDLYQKAFEENIGDKVTDHLAAITSLKATPRDARYKLRFINYQKPDVYYQLGLCYLDLQDYKNAEKYFKLAAAFHNPNSKLQFDMMSPTLSPDFVPFSQKTGNESSKNSYEFIKPTNIAYVELYLDFVKHENIINNNDIKLVYKNTKHKIIEKVYNISGEVINNNNYKIEYLINGLNGSNIVDTSIIGNLNYKIVVTENANKNSKIYTFSFSVSDVPMKMLVDTNYDGLVSSEDEKYIYSRGGFTGLNYYCTRKDENIGLIKLYINDNIINSNNTINIYSSSIPKSIKYAGDIFFNSNEYGNDNAIIKIKLPIANNNLDIYMYGKNKSNNLRDKFINYSLENNNGEILYDEYIPVTVCPIIYINKADGELGTPYLENYLKELIEKNVMYNYNNIYYYQNNPFIVKISRMNENNFKESLNIPEAYVYVGGHANEGAGMAFDKINKISDYTNINNDSAAISEKVLLISQPDLKIEESDYANNIENPLRKYIKRVKYINVRSKDATDPNWIGNKWPVVDKIVRNVNITPFIDHSIETYNFPNEPYIYNARKYHFYEDYSEYDNEPNYKLLVKLGDNDIPNKLAYKTLFIKCCYADEYYYDNLDEATLIYTNDEVMSLSEAMVKYTRGIMENKTIDKIVDDINDDTYDKGKYEYHVFRKEMK